MRGKKTIGLLSVVVMCFSLSACAMMSKKTDTETSASTATAPVAQNADSDTPPQPGMVSVVEMFLAEKGCNVYKSGFDENGNLVSVYFHKKCSNCKAVSDENGFAKDSVKFGFICEKCGSENEVEIKAYKHWVYPSQIKQNGDVSTTREAPKIMSYITEFTAVQGAEIYKTETDQYGKLDTCYYHKKCDACGYVSDENGTARDSVVTGYHCSECGNDQMVEIKAEWSPGMKFVVE